MFGRATARWVACLPQAQISRLWGWLARCRRPRILVELLKRAFAHGVGCNLAEAAAPLGTYPDLEAFFVRALCEGARPIDPSPDAWVSPVDGAVGAHGQLDGDTLLQVKGRPYTATELLDDPARARAFAGGTFLTLYLSPRDYHRIHAPVACAIAAGCVLPGRLMPVFPAALAAHPRLLCRNERVVLYLDGPAGPAALVAVGATLVGRIRLDFDPTVATNLAAGERRALAYAPPHHVDKGGQLGAFELGSTVVLLAAPGVLDLALEAIVARPGARLTMGERIGTRGGARP